MSSKHHFEDQLPAFALGTLTGEELRQLQAHLSRCSQCRAQLREIATLVKLLPRAAEPIEPSPETKRKLFARVEADLVQPTPEPEVLHKPATPTLLRGIILVLALALVAVLLALAPQAWEVAILLAAATTFFAGELIRRRHPSRRALAFFGIVWSALLVLVLLAGLGAAPLVDQLNQQREIAAILNAPDAQARALVGTQNAPAAQGKLVMRPGDTRAVLELSGLRPLPADKTYEFWLIRGKEAVPAGLFEVDTAGRVTMLVSASNTINGYDKLGVTIEPHAGVEQATGPLVIKYGF